MSDKEPNQSGDSTPNSTPTNEVSSGFEKEIRQYVEEEERRERERRDSPPSLTLYPGTAPVQYDYTRERATPNPANLIESTAHLVKGCMGAGLLGMHEAFMHGGIWTSLAGTMVIGFLLSYMMLLLVWSAHKMYGRIRVSRLSYPDLAEAAVATGPLKKLRKYSKAFRYAVDVLLFIEMCGTCCIFELIIARTLRQGVEGAYPEIKSEEYSDRMYVLIITLPLILLCMIRTLKYLAPAALVASLFVTFIAGATTVTSISSFEQLNERPSWKDYHGFFKFIGTCIYSVQGVIVTMPLENNMRSPHHFATVLQFGMSFVVLMVAAIGFLGYWGLGENCETPITIHLPLFTSTVILQFILVLMMSATFALHFWIAFRIIWYYIGRKIRRKKQMWELFYRAIIVVLISCISLVCPNINTMMNFLGAVICSWVCIIFPTLIDSLVNWQERRYRYRCCWFIKNIFVTAFGVTVCLGTIVFYII